MTDNDPGRLLAEDFERMSQPWPPLKGAFSKIWNADKDFYRNYRLDGNRITPSFIIALLILLALSVPSTYILCLLVLKFHGMNSVETAPSWIWIFEGFLVLISVFILVPAFKVIHNLLKLGIGLENKFNAEKG